MTTKLADALSISVDFLLGRERFREYDKDAILRLEGLQKLDEETRHKIFYIIDTYRRDAKARTAYSL